MIWDMFKDYQDNRKKSTAANSWATLINKGLFYIYHPTERTAHTIVFEIDQWVYQELVINNSSHNEWKLYH